MMNKGPVTNRRFSRLAVRNFSLIAGGVIGVLILVIGGWYFYTTSVASAKQQAQQQLENNVNTLVRNLAGPIGVITTKLKVLSEDEEIIKAFEQRDTVRLIEESERLAGLIESTRKLRMLLPGLYGPDDTPAPPLSFSALDVLNRAERSTATPKAEVHMLPDEHIALVQQVMNQEGEIIGLIYISLHSDLLAQSLSRLSLTNAYVELQQSISGKTLLLGKQGDVRSRAGEPVSAPVNGTRWTLAYWQGSATVVETNAGTDPLLILVVVLLVVGAGAGILVLRRFKGGKSPRQAASGIVYAGAVQAIMDGAHPGMEKLFPDLPILGQQQSIEHVSEGMEGDDISAITKVDDLQELDFEDVFNITEAPEDVEVAPAETPTTPPPASDVSDTSISQGIFRAYDIRGVVDKDLTVEGVNKIGQAIGSEAALLGEKAIVVGRDGRISSPVLAEALIAGLRSAGRDVIDIGMVPTPVLYFATHFLDANSDVMLTGSHNGPEYNGLKIVLAGDTLSGEAIQAIYNRVVMNNMETGQGALQTMDLTSDYICRISEDIPVALGGAFKIVVDCGNGVPGMLAPQLYRALGHDVIELYCEVDGNFPNHHPDPSQPENLQALITKVREEQADLGFAFDGDGDRLGVVDGEGKIIWPDRQLMLLAKDVLSRNQGTSIIFDVKCSRHLSSVIEENGGKPLMWKTGHSLIKAKMKEVDAPLAGEMSGHIFFKERWYGFDDALYTGARMLEVLMNAKVKPVEVFAQIPEGIATPELRVDLAEDAHQSFMEDLGKNLNFEGAKIIDIDGFRVEFEDGWGLIRPSNTSPCLILRFEADNQLALDRIQNDFRKLLQSINPDLQLSF